MKFFEPSPIIFFLVFLFTSCKNDLKLNAPYREMPSIYAMLNPQDKLQIIRINKVFLGEGDANAMAQVADSINYPENELSVTLTRNNEYGQNDYASLDKKMTIVFRDSVIQAQPGAFNRMQRVYVSSDRLFVNGKYTLTVKNSRTGNVFTARATALDSVSGQQPMLPIQAPYYPYDPDLNNTAHFINYRDVDYMRVPFIPVEAKNGDIYQLTVRFHFYDSLYNGERIYRYVDYPFANKTLRDVRKNAFFTFIPNEAKPVDLFVSIGVNLGKLNLPVNIIGRRMLKIEYIVCTASQDYADYMQFTLPSLSAATSKPLYSNFDKQAALGIFSFRTRCSVSKEMDVVFKKEFGVNPATSAYLFY